MKNTLASALLGLALLSAPALASAQGFEISIAPPALRAEVQPPAPAPGYVWTQGYWQWNGAQHVWVPGQWVMPQQPGAQWVAPQWRRGARGYRFNPGRWVGPQGTVVVQPGYPQPAVVQPGYQQPVVVPQQPVYQQPVYQQPVVVPQQPGVVVVNPGQPPMPRPRFERRPRWIGPGQLWVPGRWEWSGAQYVWRPGHVQVMPGAPVAQQPPPPVVVQPQQPGTVVVQPGQPVPPGWHRGNGWGRGGRWR